MDIANLLAHCDHTLLRPGCTWPEIRVLCDEGLAYGTASVCIPPCHVAEAARYLHGRLPVCTVIGFPHGSAVSAVKAFESADAVENGAQELDMVVNLSAVKDARWTAVVDDIAAVRRACSGKTLKVIIETCLLTEEEKRCLCRIVSDSGAEFIKTSTGFSTGGATRDDVVLLRQCCDAHVRVKAAGGIASLQDAQDFLTLGADRLGTSRIVRLAAAAGFAAKGQAAPQS